MDDMRLLSSQPSLSQLSPEAQLLLCCARTAVEPETVARIRELLQGEIDWPFLVQFASHHSLTPLLYWNLNANFSDTVPAAVLEQLRREFIQNAQHSLHLTRELIKLLTLLDENQISAVPYKGPVLAHQAYNNLAFRQYCDLDILVQKHDVLRTMRLITKYGYQVVTPLDSEEHAADLLATKKDFRLISNDGRVILELHWRLTGKKFYFSFELEQIFKRLVPVTVAGVIVLNFAPEDYLLILCAHGSKHFWLRLLCGFATSTRFIRRHPDLDWKLLLQRSAACGSSRMLLLGLHLTRDLFGTTLPQLIEDEIRADLEVQALGREVVHHVFFGTRNGVGRTQLNPDELYSVFIRMREHRWDKVRLKYRYYRGFLHIAVTPKRPDRELVAWLRSGVQFPLLRAPASATHQRVLAASPEGRIEKKGRETTPLKRGPWLGTKTW